MRFRTKSIVLGALFLVLLAALIVGGLVTPQGVSQRSAAKLLVPGFRPGDAAKIEEFDSSQHLALEKSGAWLMDVSGMQFPASPSRVAALLSSVAALPRGSLVTRDAAAAASLGIGGATTRRITISSASGVVLCTLNFGTAIPGGRGSYVSLGSASEVWSTGEALAPYVTTDRTFWGNFKIVPDDVTAAAITRISVTVRPGVSWTATKSTDAQNRLSWSLGSRPAAEVAQEKVSALANSLSVFSGSDFVLDGSQLSAVRSPSETISFSLNDGRSFELLVGAKRADGLSPCMLASGSRGYLVPQWRLQDVAVEESTLLLTKPNGSR